MKKIGKKALIRIIKLVILAIVLILLFFLIKNRWNAGKSFKDALSLLGL